MKGWRNESGRHALAARGIETTFGAYGVKPVPETQKPSDGGDWSDRFGDIVAEHRAGLTNPENVAIESYIDILDESTSHSEMQDAYTYFTDDLQDEGWGVAEASELASKLYQAHKKQITNIPRNPRNR